MPYGMCPICGAMIHLSIGDVRAWYEERHPEARVGALVPVPCPFCFEELHVGVSVVTRRLVNDQFSIEPNQQGILQSIFVDQEFGSLFNIVLDSGESITVPRAAIRKRRETER